MHDYSVEELRDSRMESLISVIIPIYNTEKYLQACVDSVLSQTYANLEIILVDDGSTDTSGFVCDQYAEKDGRVVVIHKENAGMSSARNVGLDRAKGDYICFVDSDDYIAENLCETAIRAFHKGKIDIVAFDIILTDEDGKPIDQIESSHGMFREREETLCKLLKNHLSNYAWNKIYARRVFDGICFPEGYSWEDVGTTYKLLMNADGLVSIPEKLYYYRQRKTSIIHNITAKALKDIFVMQKSRYDDLLGIYPEVAELALPLVLISALRLYDRSLWENVDQTVKTEAQEFLMQNKAKGIALQKNFWLKLYYQNQRLYIWLRVLRHKIGNAVKSVHALRS